MSPSWRASITVAALSGFYRVYVALVAPLTTPVLSDDASPAATRTDALLPSQPAAVARAHLQSAEWAAEATFQLSRGEGYAYFNQRRRIEDDSQKRVRFQPFALVWFDSRRADGVPYTVTCDSAVVEFERKFNLARANAHDNRIVGGAFTGDVRITGPDGLQVLGKDFAFSEKHGLFSPHQVSFAYGPAAGRSEQVRGSAVGFEVTLAESNESLLGQDMPRIGGFEKVVLRWNVALDIVLEDDGRLIPFSVQSDDMFEYDVVDRVATFNINVDVSRPTHLPGEPEQFDRLTCDRLELRFEPQQTAANGNGAGADAVDLSVQPAAGTANAGSRHRAGLDLDLQVRHVRAIGGEVVLTSDEHELHGQMGELFYDLASRTLELYHDVNFENVELQFGPSVLACPEIRCTLDEQDQIRAAACVGAGQAVRTIPETGEIEIESSWSEELALLPDPESEWDRLELHGDAKVLHHQQHVGIVGDVLRVWFERPDTQPSDDRLGPAIAPELTTSAAALRRVVAQQTSDLPVAMVSPHLRLETGRLEAEFSERTGLTAGDGVPAEQSPVDFLGRSTADGSQVVVHAGEVHAHVVIDAATQEPDIAAIRASTDVSIVRDAAAQQDPHAAEAVDGPFQVECEQLLLQNENGAQQLRLLGAPARLLMPERAEIEGKDILLSRGTNEATVTGPGTIVYLVDRDFDGNPLEGENRKLTVRWREQMHFDGRTARFVGDVRTGISSSDLECPEMEVRLNQDIDFADDQPRTGELEVQSIHCKHGVVGEFREWEGPSTLIGIRKMKVADLFFDRSTGEIRAQGRGRIDDWRKGGGGPRVRLAPDAVSRDNQTPPADTREWNYTWLEFGELNGNQMQQHVELSDRVQVMHGPVEHALVMFQRDDFSEDPESIKDAVWVGSDRMKIWLRPARDEQSQDWLEVIAFGNAEMEGKVFRARADSISYDQSKDLFTLKGRGSEAGIYYQEAPGQPYRENYSKSIQFWRSEGRIQADRTTGVRFAP